MFTALNLLLLSTGMFGLGRRHWSNGVPSNGVIYAVSLLYVKFLLYFCFENGPMNLKFM